MTASQLCTACQAIFSGRLRVAEAPEDALYPPEPQRYTHHDSPESFVEAVRLGCAICRRVRTRLAGQIIVPRQTRSLSSERSQGRRRCTTWAIVSAAAIDDEGGDEGAEEEEQEEEEEDSGLSLVIVAHESYFANAEWPSSRFAILTHNGRYSNLSEVLRQHVAVDRAGTGSGEAWSLAHHWYSQCVNSHEDCNPADPDFLPTRLLEINLQDPTAPVRLIVTAEVEGASGQSSEILDGHSSFGRLRYATLSHCWGGADVPTLTSHTIRSLRQGTQQDSLPRTFAEAIAVVRRLGIRYLWIDSLCIVQDSPADWAAEAGIMGDVYKNSTINIMATASRDSHGGLFRERADPQTGLDTLGLIHVEAAWSTVEDGGAHRVFPMGTSLQLTELDLWQVSVAEAPLNTRGWVLQERVLSPRALHFGKEQLLWECRSLNACELFPEGLPDVLLGNIDRIKPVAPRIKGAIDITHIPHGAPLQLGASPETSTQQFDALKKNMQQAVLAQLQEARRDHWMFETASLWSNWVEMYSAAKLTRRSDKMIAISGLAKYMQDLRSGDRYLAGLWAHEFVDQLLWYAIHPMPTAKLPPRVAGVAAAIVPVQGMREGSGIPSWSWASVDTGVIPGFPIGAGALRHVEVVGVTTTPASGHDEAGVLLGGELWVRPTCPLLAGILSPPDVLILDGIGRVHDAEVYPDEEVHRQAAVVLIKVMTHDRPSGTEVSALALQSVQNMPRGHYRRVGCITTYGSSLGAPKGQDNQDSLYLKDQPGVIVIL
ncbi:heterokaryon incompatibility protein-domain-containing protein [Microdochium bolleyi]|uniref:Heterokaryon incompatibility protein-domain-containing protein n=1 Tax=Microdochium bolleyi TaxID=196109 RepID=A0A136JCP0_9PEZI|nr:heterokaryon incompatibility protein-domain-containing protein [Microdochium bolleyi]